jgi:hypothetical protein
METRHLVTLLQAEAPASLAGVQRFVEALLEEQVTASTVGEIVLRVHGPKNDGEREEKMNLARQCTDLRTMEREEDEMNLPGGARPDKRTTRATQKAST